MSRPSYIDKEWRMKMAEKKTRICAVCRKQYTFCPVCNEDKEKPIWYFTFCSENCHDLYGVLSGYEDGNISSDEANKKIKAFDLSRYDFFGDSYKKTIEKLKECDLATQNKEFNDSQEEKKEIMNDIAKNIKTAKKNVFDKPVKNVNTAYVVDSTSKVK